MDQDVLARARALLLAKQEDAARQALESAAELAPPPSGAPGHTPGDASALAGALALRAVLRWRASDAHGALEDATRAVAAKPSLPATWALKAHLHAGRGEGSEAIAAAQAAASHEPANPAHRVNLGEYLRQARRLTEAESVLEQAVQSAPGHAGAWTNYGTVLQELERTAEAMAAYEKALALQPAAFAVVNNLGGLAMREHQFDKARQCFEQAVALNPASAEAYANLGSALKELKRHEDSLRCCRQAVELGPGVAAAHASLALALVDVGSHGEARASFRRALALDPSLSAAHSNMLFTAAAYDDALSPEQYLADARRWEHGLSQPGAVWSPASAFRNPPRQRRRLKVGYVSGDFRDHAVSKFIEPVLRHHDAQRVEVFGYTTYPFRDGTTDRLRGYMHHWRSLVGKDTGAASAAIRGDGIDVLIDLSGHTRHARLDVFAFRCAPVQAHYLGYFASTGISQMDYWIGDATLCPASHDAHYSETIWRLARTWYCYSGPQDAPVTRWQPAPGGTVCLGSFNNLNKVTPATVALWSAVLRALPESRLLLKTAELADANNRERILKVFGEQGVARERIELKARVDSWADHMALYDSLDIALDPTGGIGGATTTCDALWMGVPVVTLAGNRTAGRMAASLIAGAGHAEWIASDTDDYVDRVVRLARDPAGRQAQRATQRERMQASPVCDAPGMAAALEDAYDAMFDRWTLSRE